MRNRAVIWCDVVWCSTVWCFVYGCGGMGPLAAHRFAISSYKDSVETMNDFCKSLQAQFIRPWQHTYQIIQPHSQLSAAQLMVSACALFHEKWHNNWASKVCCILYPRPTTTLCDYGYMPELTPEPYEMLCAMLHTPGHWMMFLEYKDRAYAVDGKDHPALMDLAKEAHQELAFLATGGAPMITHISKPRLFTQYDDTSCGLYNLDVLKHVLSDAPVNEYVQGDEDDWSPLTDHLASCALTAGTFVGSGPHAFPDSEVASCKCVWYVCCNRCIQ
jgi:hypothetical protein